jgi:pantothenate kinase type III
MILAIDVGNTETDFGVWDETRWVARWEHPTASIASRTEFVNWLSARIAALPL